MFEVRKRVSVNRHFASGRQGLPFSGGDSLRILPLAPLSNDSFGWSAKYSYLFPGKGWEQCGYDDSLWNEGKGAFGPLRGVYRFTLHGELKIYMSAGM